MKIRLKINIFNRKNTLQKHNTRTATKTLHKNNYKKQLQKTTTKNNCKKQTQETYKRPHEQEQIDEL